MTARQPRPLGQQWRDKRAMGLPANRNPLYSSNTQTVERTHTDSSVRKKASRPNNISLEIGSVAPSRCPRTEESY